MDATPGKVKSASRDDAISLGHVSSSLSARFFRNHRISGEGVNEGVTRSLRDGAQPSAPFSLRGFARNVSRVPRPGMNRKLEWARTRFDRFDIFYNSRD